MGLTEEHTHPEVSQLTRVSVPIDVGDGFKPIMEALVLRYLSVKTSNKLGYLFARIKVATSVLHWLRATHGEARHTG